MDKRLGRSRSFKGVEKVDSLGKNIQDGEDGQCQGRELKSSFTDWAKKEGIGNKVKEEWVQTQRLPETLPLPPGVMEAVLSW